MITSIYTISDSQIVTFSNNHLVSFSTDMGKNYLARNKASIEAQKTGIRLQKDLVQEQNANMAIGNFGGGVSGALLSSLNPVNYATANSYARTQNNMVGKIAVNNIRKINGTITDARGSSPSMNISNDNQVSPLMNGEFVYKINYVMYRPNKIIRNKVVNHFDRFGYKIDDYVTISNGMFDNRTKFNYFEIDDLKDYLITTDTLDIDVVKLIDIEFKKGLRLWHESSVNYGTMNIEKVIYDNI